MRSNKAKYMEQQRFSGLRLVSVRKSMNLIGSFNFKTAAMLSRNALPMLTSGNLTVRVPAVVTL